MGRSQKLRGESLEQLFAVYDPTFLAVVWPKISNGVHLDVSHFCWEDVSVFFKDLSEGRAWAFNGKWNLILICVHERSTKSNVGR